MMLQSTLGSNSAARKECRFYQCDSCGLFHLTSMPLAEYEAKKLGTMNEPTQYLNEAN